jgi:hypothetical protein
MSFQRAKNIIGPFKLKRTSRKNAKRVESMLRSAPKVDLETLKRESDEFEALILKRRKSHIQ